MERNGCDRVEFEEMYGLCQWVGINVFYIVLFRLGLVSSSNVIRFCSTRQIEEFLESLVPTKGHSLIWFLNYNDLHEDTHHYGPSDPVGSFCGIAEK